MINTRRLFAKRTLQGTKALVLIIISLILIFCDRNLNCFTALRSNITTPLHKAINFPSSLLQKFSNNLLSKNKLIKENAKLCSELVLAHAELQKLAFLEQENSQLRDLLNLSKQFKAKFFTARLISFNPNDLTVDKGKIDNIYIGQPVVDAYGLFGQVILVGTKTSKILPITDAKSAVPVMIIRNGTQLIAVGSGHSKMLELVNTSETTDIKEGDVLVTSGMGQRFPSGLMVGKIKSIKRISGERFIKALIIPSAHINSSSNVLLVSNKRGSL